jgi:hypothetical protein
MPRFVSLPRSLPRARDEAWSALAHGARDGVFGRYDARGWLHLAGGEHGQQQPWAGDVGFRQWQR